MPSNSSMDEYPSLLWVSIPPILLISGYYIRKWYLARRMRLYGIGKNAPGFQTGVRRVRVTPEIAARIRRGEDVSPKEIEAASRKADLDEEEQRRSGSHADADSVSSSGSYNGKGLPRGVLEERDDRHLINGQAGVKEEVNEWLPESTTKANRRKKGRK